PGVRHPAVAYYRRARHLAVLGQRDRQRVAAAAREAGLRQQPRVPNAVQRGAKRNGAPLIRDPGLSPRKESTRGPGSAAHHFVLRRARDTGQGYDCPPEQLITCPVMKLASSEARNAIAAACSSAVPRRLSACWLRMSSPISRRYFASSSGSSTVTPGAMSWRGTTRSVMSVPPGAITLTRML